MDTYSQIYQQKADELNALNFTSIDVNECYSKPGKLIINGRFDDSRDEAKRRSKRTADILYFESLPPGSQSFKLRVKRYRVGRYKTNSVEFTLIAEDNYLIREVLARAGVPGVWELPPCSGSSLKKYRRAAAKQQKRSIRGATKLRLSR